jgi:hypothetical protein
MSRTYEACATYVARVADLLERYGLVLRQPAEGDDLVLAEDEAGVLSYELWGDLPDADDLTPARIEIREEFAPVGPDVYERTRYEYELRDEARGYRRAFHLHSPESFMRAYLVVVHEHCERPIGARTCQHYEGSPVRDAFAGVGALIDAWTGDPPDCRRLRCLDDRRPRRPPLSRSEGHVRPGRRLGGP